MKCPNCGKSKFVIGFNQFPNHFECAGCGCHWEESVKPCEYCDEWKSWWFDMNKSMTDELWPVKYCPSCGKAFEQEV